jgi:hypothetical protein
MGGWGSGSRRSASKKTSSYLSLDVRRLLRRFGFIALQLGIGPVATRGRIQLRMW